MCAITRAPIRVFLRLALAADIPMSKLLRTIMLDATGSYVGGGWPARLREIEWRTTNGA